MRKYHLKKGIHCFSNYKKLEKQIDPIGKLKLSPFGVLLYCCIVVLLY